MEQFEQNLNHNENSEGKIDKQKVVESLKAKGFEDPETMELVVKWTEQREHEVEQSGFFDERVLFELERSELYLAVGDTEGARECITDILTMALNEGKDDWVEKLEKVLSGM